MHAHGLHASCLFQSSNTFPKCTYYPLPRPLHFTDDPPSCCIRDINPCCSLTPYIVRIQTLNTRRRRFGVWKRVSFSLFTAVGLFAGRVFIFLSEWDGNVVRLSCVDRPSFCLSLFSLPSSAIPLRFSPIDLCPFSLR